MDSLSIRRDSAIGIYGVMSLVVTARTREIGIRIALGADHQRVQGLIVGEAVAFVATCAGLGVSCALTAHACFGRCSTTCRRPTRTRIPGVVQLQQRRMTDPRRDLLGVRARSSPTG
jgi:ABC-type lipoprotein release transport system permease subunit